MIHDSLRCMIQHASTFPMALVLGNNLPFNKGSTGVFLVNIWSFVSFFDFENHYVNFGT